MRVVLATCVLCWSATLAAQDAPSDAIRTEARAAFEEGRRALEQGDAARGIEALERSFDLLPYLPTAYNLAVAHSEGGEASRAANLAHAILEGDFGSLEPRQRSEAEALLAIAAARAGRVTVRIEGADEPWLEVDDESVAVSAGRVATVYVRPG
jgi:hypothetical protein